MKQVFNYLNALAVVAVMLTAVGCSNDNEVTQHEIVEGQSTYINLSFKASALTRADDTQAGTTEESTVNTIDIFIFDTASGSLLTNYSFTPGQMDVSTDGKTYSTKEPLLTSIGYRSVYAVVNLPATWTIGRVSDLTETVYTASSTTLTADLATAGSFVMTSKTSEAAKNFDPWDGSTGNCPANNKVALKVQRAVAKFSMEVAADVDINTGEGSISDLKFGVGQVNTETFAVQYIDGNVIKDPNYGSKSGKLSGANDVSEWMDVFDGKGSSLDANALYAPENTSADTDAANKTYVAVQAKYAPKKIMKEDSNGKWNEEDVSGAYNGDFWVIKFEEYNVYFSTEDEAKGYFAYLIANKVLEADAEVADYITKYTGGHCYYTVYVNEGEDYNVYRNEFYKGLITEINGLGDPMPGKYTPGKIVKPAYINVELTVLDWVLVPNDYILTPQ